ncbi:hypothetical protein [Pseudobutyrivibrio xylanivorans]|uniref:Poly(3-hydroxybutyrate) depolymerase n=1 Tax=Pseudobutyrivibrio xylanivorans TaxID=185007 RepID=A0A1G5RUB2_PSEXY|nr:hypothetical protein [Pseudobutyrivibrio xylanivorans]SCZ77300.1 hypothetical protein SAMN02910350_00664 [Pseudobutyrivibrio xylanivorans]
MGIFTRPVVKTLDNGGKFWEHTYNNFHLKAYVPTTDIDGEVHNYGFRAPLLLVFEEERLTEEKAIEFAETSGLASIASANDSTVLFVYPTCEGGWDRADVSLYQELIAETKIDPIYSDGIVEYTNFFDKEFKGYFIRGAIFRADIYSFGQSADYCAKHLLKTINGEYLWGPGEITPAMISMEGLSVVPDVQRTDIAVLSVDNPDEINKFFDGCENLLIKEKADYKADFYSFVRKFKMWCGQIEFEPDFDALNMVEKRDYTEVKTSPDHKAKYKDVPTHKVGYFVYYNKGLFDNGPVPLVVGFHGGGDSSMYLTFVSGWWEVCHKFNFLYVGIENHQNVTPTEAIEVIEDLKRKYDIDEHRIYATGFSMGSAKTWDMFQEYPEVFAGLAPTSALFPIKDNPFGLSLGDPRMNMTISVPMFYSGGEESVLPELPFQDETSLDRIKYAAKVNKLTVNFDVDYANKSNWKDSIYGVPGDRVEKILDPSRGSVLTVNYYNSEDGVCRTAFGSVSGQIHECREHSIEEAWKFISKFTR